MALTRHSQLFRNTTFTTYSNTFEEALLAVKSAVQTNITNLRDGEVIVGRYNTDITDQQSGSGIVLGVVRVDGNTKTVDYIADERLVRELLAGVNTRINDLDLAAETVGTLNTSATVSTVTLYNVSQENGQVSVGTTSDTLDIVMDGQYNATNNRVALESTVTDAINSITSSESLLTVSADQKTYTFGTLLTQTNGVNDITGSESLYFYTAPTSSNWIVTQADISGLASAMHYRGTVSQSGGNLVPDPSTITTSETGDVFVVSSAFTLASATQFLGKTVPPGSYEAGDMLICNGTSWTAVSGENQVEAGDVSVTVGNGTQGFTTIGTVDGTPLKIRVSDTYATLLGTADADDVQSPTTAGGQINVLNRVEETNGVISAVTAYTLSTAASTGAAADVSIADSGNNFMSTNVEDALAELAAKSLTVDGGSGISVTTGNQISTVSVDLAAKSYDSTTSTYNTNADNLLVFGPDSKLSISDTWDCGTY